MPEFDYECTECGTVHPLELVVEEKWEGDESEGYPPDEMEAICGRRWTGCGDVTTHVRPRTTWKVHGSEDWAILSSYVAHHGEDAGDAEYVGYTHCVCRENCGAVAVWEHSGSAHALCPHCGLRWSPKSLERFGGERKE